MNFDLFYSMSLLCNAGGHLWFHNSLMGWNTWFENTPLLGSECFCDLHKPLHTYKDMWVKLENSILMRIQTWTWHHLFMKRPKQLARFLLEQQPSEVLPRGTETRLTWRKSWQMTHFKAIIHFAQRPMFQCVGGAEVGLEESRVFFHSWRLVLKGKPSLVVFARPGLPRSSSGVLPALATLAHLEKRSAWALVHVASPRLPHSGAGSWVQEGALQEGRHYDMATRSSVLAWMIAWAEEPVGLQSTGSQRSQIRLSD